MNTIKRLIDANPCPESWGEMETVPEGKYCHVCKAKVYDLFNKSLEEIESNYLNKDVCVSMTSNQVDAFRLIHPLKRIAVAAFLIFGTSLFTISYSQETINSIEVHKIEKCKFYGRYVYRNSNKQVTGRTVTIETEKEEYTTETDKKGRYFIMIPQGEKIIKIEGLEVDLFVMKKKSVNLGKRKIHLRMGRFIGCPSF